MGSSYDEELISAMRAVLSPQFFAAFQFAAGGSGRRSGSSSRRS